MNPHVESFWEYKQSELLALHQEHEDSYDVLVRYIENKLDLSGEQKEKVGELMENVYGTLENIKLEIL